MLLLLLSFSGSHRSQVAVAGLFKKVGGLGLENSTSNLFWCFFFYLFLPAPAPARLILSTLVFLFPVQIQFQVYPFFINIFSGNLSRSFRLINFRATRSIGIVPDCHHESFLHLVLDFSALTTRVP